MIEGFILGLFVGSSLGFLVMAIVNVSSIENSREEDGF